MDFNLTKEQQLLLLGLLASIVVGLGVTAYRNFFTGPSREITVEEPKAPAQSFTVMVHVCGAVKREGVYKLNSGDRLLDALKAAGGSLSSADLSALNLAEPLKDGQKVEVPVKREVFDRISGNPDIRLSGTHLSKVNINTADEKALDSLPGIGPAMAKAIIEYRRTKGPFVRAEQIMEIPRFGKSKFEKIRERITI